MSCKENDVIAPVDSEMEAFVSMLDRVGVKYELFHMKEWFDVDVSSELCPWASAEFRFSLSGELLFVDLEGG